LSEWNRKESWWWMDVCKACEQGEEQLLQLQIITQRYTNDKWVWKKDNGRMFTALSTYNRQQNED